MASYDLILKNGTLVNYNEEKVTSIAVKDGKIVKIGDFKEDASEIVNAAGLHVLPGIIDSQVHFRDPGSTHKEDLETGARAAALGGVCTFMEMPNTRPSTTSIFELQNKLKLASDKSCTNYGFYIGASEDNLEELLKAHECKGCCGVKIFLGSSTGDLLLYKRDILLEIFKNVTMPIAVHSESENRLNQRIHLRDNAKSVHAHYDWRDEESALESTKMIIGIAKEAKRKVHVLHISTKEEIEFLAKNKEHCTVEVTPQHLTLFAPDIYDKIDTFAQMNPPIRRKDHLDGLWKGIKEGVVDIIASDHAPHTIEEKKQGYPKSPAGMPGVQTILSILLHHVDAKRISVQDIAKYMCFNPSKLYGLNKGLISEGYDADFTLVNLKKEQVITNEAQASKCGWTPYAGMKITGAPVQTIVMGNVIMKDGEIKKRKGYPIERAVR